MQKHQQIILAAVLAQAVLFSTLYYVRLSNDRHLHASTVSAAALTGDKRELAGDVHAWYTLVEFGDYQCPPCAHSSSQVKSLLAKHPGQLNFRFRHYPLPMHKNAMSCALTAEEARASGRFWEMHDSLYALDTHVSSDEVAKMLLQRKFDLKHIDDKHIQEAKSRVQQDIKLGNDCKIEGTPTFVLCCPDGRVVALDAPSQAEALIR